jgi:hypothetical protein
VEAAIASVSDSSLLPDGVKGTADASEYITNAQDMARLVARDLDVAQQKKSTTVDIRLPDAYGNVKDKSEIVARVAAIIRLVRNALPHHASQVMYIDIYVGKHLAQRVVRTGGE